LLGSESGIEKTEAAIVAHQKKTSAGRFIQYEVC
jgi:hypothetical protein